MMKNLDIMILMVVSAVLFSCSGNHRGYTVHNRSDENIKDKAVVLKRDELIKYVDISGSKIVLVTDNEGNYLASQCDDINGDGKWDELAFLIDLNKGEKKSVYFEAVEMSKAPHYTKRTNIRFGDIHPPYNELLTATRLKSTDTKISQKVFQMEGPAWENDVIGFRNYFDARNGMDIYGKRTSRMVLDSVGLPGQQTYHELAEWGMDVLKVGNSLGAGAIGLQIGDLIYRIGSSGEGKYRFICEGPVRAMFEFTFKGEEIAERNYDIKHRISIYAGDQFYRSRVTVSGLKGDEKLITGIVDHDITLDKGEYKGVKYFYTLGPQAFDHESLGMAIMVSKRDLSGSFIAPGEGDGIIKTHVVSMKIENSKPVEFAFLAGWELQNSRFTDKNYFESVIRKSILKLPW